MADKETKKTSSSSNDFPPNIHEVPQSPPVTTDTVLDSSDILNRLERIERYQRMSSLGGRASFDDLKDEFAKASDENRAANAKFVRDVEHADDNWLQRGVRWVEDSSAVRRYIIPTAKVAGAAYASYKGVRLAWTGVKFMKNWIAG